MTTSRPVEPAADAAAGRRARFTREGLGSPALALGLLAVGTCGPAWFGAGDWFGWFGVGFGLAALVVGFVGARRAFRDPERTGGAALGGLALGLVGLVVGASIVVPGLLGVGTFGEGLTLDECMAQAEGQQQGRMCASQHIDEYRARFGDPATG